MLVVRLKFIRGWVAVEGVRVDVLDGTVIQEVLYGESLRDQATHQRAADVVFAFQRADDDRRVLAKEFWV